MTLYNDGLIYREKRMVNWCSTLKTAISDEEVLRRHKLLRTDSYQVEHAELKTITKLKVPGHGDKTYEFGAIWDFAYKVDGSGIRLAIKF